MDRPRVRMLFVGSRVFGNVAIFRSPTRTTGYGNTVERNIDKIDTVPTRKLRQLPVVQSVNDTVQSISR